MEPNIGAQDRTVRLVLGALFAIVGVAALAEIVALGPILGVLALLVGVILLATAATRTCPAYLATGMSTLKRRS